VPSGGAGLYNFFPTPAVQATAQFLGHELRRLGPVTMLWYQLIRNSDHPAVMRDIWVRGAPPWQAWCVQHVCSARLTWSTSLDKGLTIANCHAGCFHGCSGRSWSRSCSSSRC
jgi:hypothetical protein